MYKILLLKRATTPDPLWITYKIETETDGVKEKVDFETDNMETLESKIKELLTTIPKNQIKPIQDLEFVVDVVVNEVGIIA